MSKRIICSRSNKKHKKLVTRCLIFFKNFYNRFCSFLLVIFTAKISTPSIMMIVTKNKKNNKFVKKMNTMFKKISNGQNYEKINVLNAYYQMRYEFYQKKVFCFIYFQNHLNITILIYQEKLLTGEDCL